MRLPDLAITKSVSPSIVAENGQITYTFLIENYGNTEASASDNVIITDTFNPILTGITVTYNGNAWTAPASYTYNEATGEFATVAGQITVPAKNIHTEYSHGSHHHNTGNGNRDRHRNHLAGMSLSGSAT